MSYKDSNYMIKFRQRNKRTISGWVTKVYGKMKASSKHRKMPLPDFTKEQFKEWAIKNGLETLMADWIKSECLKNLTPSVNRLDDYKSYTFNNIELTIWKINNSKGRKSERTIALVHSKLGGIAKKIFSRPVIQKDLDNNILAIYPSSREAARRTGADNSSIAKTCRGELKQHFNFKWSYEF